MAQISQLGEWAIVGFAMAVMAWVIYRLTMFLTKDKDK